MGGRLPLSGRLDFFRQSHVVELEVRIPMQIAKPLAHLKVDAASTRDAFSVWTERKADSSPAEREIGDDGVARAWGESR